MRKILFRGKSTDTGEWVYGYLVNGKWYIDESEMAVIIPTDEFITAYNEFSYEIVHPETVGQYTGMTDTSGIPIFEDDILKLDYTAGKRGVEGCAKVVFENGKFGVLWGWNLDFVCLDGFANTTITVIGNRHDNPYLI